MGVFAAILLGLGIVGLVLGFLILPKNEGRRGEPNWRKIAQVAGTIVLILGLAFGFKSLTYTQEVGQAKVVKSWTGEYINTDLEPGLSFKAPSHELVSFDLLNKQSIYKGNGEPTSKDEEVNGPEITIQDKDKVSANVDVAIRYSLDAAAVPEIYTKYLSQTALETRLIDQDMRSEVRNSFSKYTTAQVMEQREEIEKVIADKLSERWADDGVVVNSVGLQGIRYPEATINGFTDAQQSVTNLKKAEADLKVKEAETQQKVIEARANADAAIAKAKGEAEANRLVSKSITDPLLRKAEIDAFAQFGKDGNSVIYGGTGQGILDLRGSKK